MLKLLTATNNDERKNVNLSCTPGEDQHQLGVHEYGSLAVEHKSLHNRGR